MQKFKYPVRLCALAGLLMGLAFGRFRAASLPVDSLAACWPLLIPVALLAVLAYAPGEAPIPGPRPAGFRLAEIAAALCVFAAAASFFGNPDAGPLALIRAIFPTLCGFGMILSASDKGGEMPALGSVIPVFYQGFLLLQLYRANATDTHRVLFAVELFCVIALLLSVYGAASVRFQPYSRLRGSLFGGLGLYAAGLLLMPALLAPEHVFSHSWMSGALLLSQLGMAIHGAASVLFPPPPEEEEAEEEEEALSEEDTLPDLSEEADDPETLSKEKDPE